MSSHSPGPWRWNAEGEVLLASDDMTVCDFGAVGLQDGGVPPEAEDAALIAAAPAMAEMLRELRTRLARRTVNERHGPDCVNCQADKELCERAAVLLKEIP